MPTKFILSVTSYDRAGIVADVTEVVQQFHGNLEDVSQTVLRGYFSMILLVAFPDNVSEEDIRVRFGEKENLEGCELTLMPYVEIGNGTDETETNSYVLTASGKDQPGLVATISRMLCGTGGNIVDLSTTTAKGIYTMMFLVNFPASTDIIQLKNDLQKVTKPFGITIGLRHRKLFDMVNEI